MIVEYDRFEVHTHTKLVNWLGIFAHNGGFLYITVNHETIY